MNNFLVYFKISKKKKKIPSILGFPNLNFIRKEMKDNSINLYHQLNELKKIKMYFNNNNSILLEKIFPLSISLKRLRDLLSIN